MGGFYTKTGAAANSEEWSRIDNFGPKFITKFLYLTPECADSGQRTLPESARSREDPLCRRRQESVGAVEPVPIRGIPEMDAAEGISDRSRARRARTNAVYPRELTTAGTICFAGARQPPRGVEGTSLIRQKAS